jgi:glutaredoxin 3
MRQAREIVVYTLRGCPFCVRAMSLFDAKQVQYREVDVTSDWDERRKISDRSGHRTFPQIFIGDAFIGGCEELYTLERAGKLDPMLA